MCRKHRGARRITVHVSASRGVWVTLPFYQSFRDAENVVKLNRQWIERTYKKAKHDHEQAQPLRDKLAAIDALQAKRSLTLRLGELAQRHGFCFRRVSIRNQRTRWGSCSSKQCISLNVKLMLLPEELRDYVMLHELVHTRVHNHSPAFYAELDKVAENRRHLTTRLKEISLHEL
ncbi:MAG: M48 family metallopeptidase [Dehalococcoidales bacterium]|nr:M48 family metallopeptidase [Dehalococcoidales bacterium]